MTRDEFNNKCELAKIYYNEGRSNECANIINELLTEVNIRIKANDTYQQAEAIKKLVAVK